MKLKSEILDDFLEKNLMQNKIIETFDKIKSNKVDIYSEKIKISKGSDQVDLEKIENNFDRYLDIIRIKGLNGKYKFSAMKESEIPKSPYIDLLKAKKAKKVRIISISTIMDTIFQNIIYNSVLNHYNKLFFEIDNNVFSYRRGKSSKDAIILMKKYIEEGYINILDADIEKYFDNVDHCILSKKVQNFFGKENILINNHIVSFIKVKKITTTNKKKERKLGIPQGGVLSGMLANIYLYEFDIEIVKLSKIYDFKYIRYSDDFILMFKDNRDIKKILKIIINKIKKIKLTIHSLEGEKTNIVDLTKNSTDFLGFNISLDEQKKVKIKIKKDNVEKLRLKIIEKIKKIDYKSNEKYLKEIFEEVNRSIVGPEYDFNKRCGEENCGGILKKRSWIGYFQIVNDVNQLKKNR